MHEFLQTAVSAGALRSVDYHFARRMASLAGDDDPCLLLGAALVSRRVGEGDVCLDLAACGDFKIFQAESPGSRVEPPSSKEWSRALSRSSVVGRPGDDAPLILDDHGRLYLGRYWHFERGLIEKLSKRLLTWAPNVDWQRLGEGLCRLYSTEDEIDWQRLAAAIAVLRPFCVISGGPGTGKTRTVASILALLLEQSDSTPLRIALAAPTGKAAARLTESIRAVKRLLSLDPTIADGIPEQAVTLHRLLGFRPGRANPRHGPHNPLHLDVLVVDEASMVDLPMMARLLQGLSERARLILLGDKDQLSSVEAGMVLGDVCGRGVPDGYSAEQCNALKAIANTDLEPAPQRQPPVADHIVVLRKSWRFDAGSGIGALARAVNEGMPEKAVSLLNDRTYPNLQWHKTTQATLDRLASEIIVPAFRELIDASEPGSALALLNRLRVLCAVREGPFGVRALNTYIEGLLEQQALIRPIGEVYAGRPVMVTMNDHAQKLYNGDVGLLLRDPDADGALRVFFETTEGVRRVLPSRLPPHETVYAMTVHKSQGSEFDEVLLILPDLVNQVVTRELIYTGITRARQRVHLVSSQASLADAINTSVKRSTGLFDALWGTDGLTGPNAST